MNARQKAKKYKKELERLRSIPDKPVFVHDQIHVEQIKASIMYGDISDEYAAEILYKKICNSEPFRNAVNIKKESNERNEWVGVKKYTATLQVLR